MSREWTAGATIAREKIRTAANSFALASAGPRPSNASTQQLQGNREHLALARNLHNGAAGGRAMTQLAERTALNHLIETCTDAARGFRSAAAHVRDERLKAFFERVADARERFAAKLLPQAQRLGGDAPADGTRAAALHRGWIDLKSRLTHGDRAILAEAQRGDCVTLHVFKDALGGMLPPDARDLVEEQYVAVRSEHETIESFYPRIGI